MPIPTQLTAHHQAHLHMLKKMAMALNNDPYSDAMEVDTKLHSILSSWGMPESVIEAFEKYGSHLSTNALYCSIVETASFNTSAASTASLDGSSSSLFSFSTQEDVPDYSQAAAVAQPKKQSSDVPAFPFLTKGDDPADAQAVQPKVKRQKSGVGFSTQDCDVQNEDPADIAQASQPQKSSRGKFDVRAILSSSKKGIKAIDSVETKHTVTPDSQHTISDMCCRYLIRVYDTDKPSSDVKEAMAQSIIIAFPCLRDPEGKGYEQWYTKGTKYRSAAGALESRLRQLRRNSKEVDVTTKEKKSEDVSDHPTYDRGEMEDLTEQLKHISDQKKICEGMRKTAIYRHDMIMRGEDVFEHMFDEGMICQDYEVLNPEKANLMFQKWPVLSALILRYASSMSPSWTTKLNIDNVDEKGLSTDERMNMAFHALPFLFEGRKTAKGGRASAAETLDLFIDIQKEGVSIDEYITTLDEKKSQPFILSVGGTVMKPSQQFIIVERRVMEVKTLLAAIDVAYKTYQVMHLKYASPTVGVWNFLDSLVYNVKLQQEQGTIKAFRAFYHFESGQQL